jgi:hypothetical protein
MESIIISASCVLLGLEVFLLWRYQRDELRSCRESYLTCLEEVARAAAITKRSCFASLDDLHNRLETLSSRTASAEQKSSDRGDLADLVGKERSQGAVPCCAGDASICTDDVSICTDDVSIEPVDVMPAPPASMEDSLQGQQTPAVQERESSIAQSDREPAKPARRSLKKKPLRREARKPIGSMLPMDGVVRYSRAAARPAMAVKV